MFAWVRDRRRRKLLAGPFPPEWLAVLEGNVWQYGTLSAAEQAKLRDDLRVLAAEKNWEGCGGLRMTDEIRVTIAAYAALLVLAGSVDAYRRVISILVYPEEFLVPQETVTEGGLVVEEMEDRMGESWHDGAVVISWADVLASGRRRGGINVAIHEFAHQLAALSVGVDGVPIWRRDAARRWHKVMTAEFNRLVEASEQGRATVLDDYGATDLGEFFAVATETFFERPVQLQRGHPQLYAILSEFYRQDPAGRSARRK